MTTKVLQISHKMLYWLTKYLLAEGKKDRKPAFDIPDIREYFLDLELVLGVISDGPTKSFAFRRLQYLSGKFTMYSHLNEFQELADMKVQNSLRNLDNLYLHLISQRIPHRFVPNEILSPSMLNWPLEIFTTFEKSILMCTIQAAWTKSIYCALSNPKWSAARMFVGTFS